MICHVSKFYKSRISSGVFFFFFLALLQGLWDLCSLARNQTWATAAEESGSNHWTAREFPEISVYAAFQMFYNHTWLVAAVLDSMVLTTSAHVDLYNFMERSSKVCACMLSHALCNPTDSSLPGSSVHGISQARILATPVAIPFSRGSSQPRDRIHIS